jgi:hypothetical protein
LGHAERRRGLAEREHVGDPRRPVELPSRPISNTTAPTTEAKPTPHAITLIPAERTALLRCYRGPFTPALRLRAHVLLLADGRPWDDLARALYCSSRTIARGKARFERDRLAALTGATPGHRPAFAAAWAAAVVS